MVRDRTAQQRKYKICPGKLKAQKKYIKISG